MIVGLGVLVLTPRFAGAQIPSIDHQAVGCAVAEKFPRLEARFAPAGTVAVARVVFQPENTQQWYVVAMKAEGSASTGVLPKPKKSLKAFKYYIEVTDKALGTNRTADYTTNVVGGSAECKGKMMAGALGSASVLLQVPAGAAALPAGFASTGVVAAGSGSAVAATGAAAGGGGGLGTGAIVGIVAGVGAVAGGVAVAAGKSGESSTPAASIPSTATPTPAASVAGTWVGRAPDGWTTFESRANCGRDVHDLDLVLTQTGSSIAGTMKWTTRESYDPSSVGTTNTISLTGTVNGNAVTFPIVGSSDGITYVASGTFTSTRMTGAVTGNSCQPMPFAVNRQ